MTTLEEQLTQIFARGLEDEPELRASLEDALSSLGDGDRAGDKATKAEANYQESGGDGDESCDTCSHFDGVNRCDVVSGLISPSGISDNYEALKGKEGEDATSE